MVISEILNFFFVINIYCSEEKDTESVWNLEHW